MSNGVLIELGSWSRVLLSKGIGHSKVAWRVLAGCALLLFSGPGWAYCRTTVCAAEIVEGEEDRRPKECDDPRYIVDGCQTGVNFVHWEQPCASFSVHSDGSKKWGITPQRLEQVIGTCFNNWLSVACPQGGTPNFQIQKFSQVDCIEAGYNKNGKNQNVWAFRDDTWPKKYDPGAIALTLVTFNQESGEIYDVDVEFNSATFEFSLDAGGSAMDLQSVVQHESGHYLGLADLYATGTTSTMYGRYEFIHDLSMRTLAEDDVAGICTVFPPVSTHVACDPTPRHGFTTQCFEPIDEKGCSCVQGGTPGAKSQNVWFIVVCVLFALRSRRRPVSRRAWRRRSVPLGLPTQIRALLRSSDTTFGRQGS